MPLSGRAALVTAFAVSVLPLGGTTAFVAHADAAPVAGSSFQVGAAVVSYTPPCGVDGTPAANNCTDAPAGFVDPADCVATATNVLPVGTPTSTVFSGKRLFAFEEPFVDAQHSGHYDNGDPFVDCNADGRWDGNYIGGGSGSPRYYDYVADPVGLRAIVVSNGTRTIAVGVLDNEGAFNTYLDAIRTDVAAAVPTSKLASADIFLSSTHDESAPDSIGLYGVSDPTGTASLTSSANLYWIHYMESQGARAIANAYAAMRPAIVSYGEAIEPADFRQCWSSYPFVDDQLIPVFRATDATTGKVIVTLADVSQHAETLGFNGGSALDPDAPKPTTLQQEKTWLSADWPYWMRRTLETRDGGIGIEMAGSVGSNETPQVFPAAVSRTPQQFVDASHPAGCRTKFVADQKTMVPLGYYSEDVALGTQLATAINSALAAGTPSASTVIEGASAPICVQTTNALFEVAGLAGVFGQRPGYADPGCTVSAPLPPSGNTTPVYLKSEVATFRIGDGSFIALPGEIFPYTFLRGSLGPADMPCPDPDSSGNCGGRASPTLTCAQGADAYAPPTWLLPHMHTPYRFIDGLGQDMIGYVFPCANGVGVPGEYPVSNPMSNNTDRFGCGHSDDSESASSDASDVIGVAVAGLLDHLGGSAHAPEDIERGRYVLPDGKLSRNPLGTTDSIGCTVSKTFAADGPAIAVALADNALVYPVAWMSLSGRAQPAGPDRNTRGWIDAAGTRHWLDVYPDVHPKPTLPTAAGSAPSSGNTAKKAHRATTASDGLAYTGGNPVLPLLAFVLVDTGVMAVLLRRRRLPTSSSD